MFVCLFLFFEVLFENHIFYEKVSSIKMIIIIICCDTQPDSSTERGEKMRKSTFELVS